MRALYKAMKLVVGPAPECEVKGFFGKSRELVEYKCVLLLVSYSCHICSGEDMSAVQLDVAMTRPV